MELNLYTSELTSHYMFSQNSKRLQENIGFLEKDRGDRRILSDCLTTKAEPHHLLHPCCQGHRWAPEPDHHVQLISSHSDSFMEAHYCKDAIYAAIFLGLTSRASGKPKGIRTGSPGAVACSGSRHQVARADHAAGSSREASHIYNLNLEFLFSIPCK